MSQITSHMASGTSYMDASIKYMADKLLTGVQSLPIEKSADIIASSISHSGVEITNGVAKAASTVGKLVYSGMTEGASSVSTSIEATAASSGECIVEGFRAASTGVSDSFYMVAKHYSDNTQYMSSLLHKLSDQNTNEFLLTSVTVAFIILPILYYLLVVLHAEKKDQRAIYVKTCAAAIVLAFLGSFMQLIRFLFDGQFTLINLCVIFFLSLYAILSMLYFIYLFCCNIRLVWTYVKSGWKFMCGDCWRKKKNRHEYTAIDTEEMEKEEEL